MPKPEPKYLYYSLSFSFSPEYKCYSYCKDHLDLVKHISIEKDSSESTSSS